MRITTIVILLFTFHFSAAGQNIDRIEPPHWWTGMKDPSLQILLHGEGIGNMVPAIQSAGITLQGFSCPGSRNYLIINMSIDPSTPPTSIPIELSDPDHKTITLEYELQERKNGSAQRTGFNTQDVIYLITPDRFVNGDSTNDIIAGMQEGLNRQELYGRHGGDIEGIRQSLDYISEMGFTAIWINPVLENNMPKSSYHGYAITDLYQVDPRFGSNESYKKLCEEAAARNIKVIMDMVANHIGLHHPWMEDPPSSDWINGFQQPYYQTNHRKTLSSDPYAASADKDILTKGWFVRTMPDLNVTNKDLATYLIQNAIWWIEYADQSGIRMDTYLYPEENFMSEWARRIMQEYPGLNIVGEVWYEDPSVISYWQDGKKNPNGYDSNLPSLCDFPLWLALVKALTSGETWDGTLTYLYEMLARDYVYPNPQNLVVFGDNHDIDRIYTQLNENYDLWKLAMTFLLTTRGIPQIYYGTEILMTNKIRNHHGEIRSDFPGGWKGDSTNVFLGQNLTVQQREAQQFLKQLLDWRKTSKAIHQGKTIHFVPQQNCYVYFRKTDEQNVMVILNKNDSPTNLSLTRFKEMFSNQKTGKNVMTGQVINLEENIILSGPEALIIEIGKD
jgi:glycosidase